MVGPAPGGHAIPVSATSAQPEQPVGELIAEIFSVTPDGRLVDALGQVPVQNGVATYAGPSPAPGLAFAIRIQRSATPGAVFRSGPLERLPGPPSPVVSNGQVSFVLARVGGISLSEFGTDGLPELLERHLRNIPPPMQFLGVELDADADGNYVVTVHGRLRVLFFPWRRFAYRRATRLAGSMEPGRPSPAVLAALVGAPAGRGANVRRHARVLDRMIKEAVEIQLHGFAKHGAALTLGITDAGFQAQTVSVSGLRVGRPFGQPGASASMTLSAGAITGLIQPPTDSAGPAAVDDTPPQ